MMTRNRAFRMVLAAGALGCMLLAGCNIVAPVALLVHGPEKTEAAFVLPPDKKTVVFVDDRNSVLPSRAIRQRISKAAEKTIIAGKILTVDMVSSDAIFPVAASERFSKPKSIAEIGKAVGAQTIIYATVDMFALSTDGAEFTPIAKLRVKVIDVETEARLWPSAESDVAQHQWFPLTYEYETRSKQLPRTNAEKTTADQALADKIGTALGNLFIKHETREANERIGQ